MDFEENIILNYLRKNYRRIRNYHRSDMYWTFEIHNINGEREWGSRIEVEIQDIFGFGEEVCNSVIHSWAREVGMSPDNKGEWINSELLNSGRMVTRGLYNFNE